MDDFMLPMEHVKGKVGMKDCNAIHSELLKG